MYKIDRDQVKADYEAGLTFRELAEKYKVGIGTISRWAKAGGWEIQTIMCKVPVTPAKTEHKKRNKAERKTERYRNETVPRQIIDVPAPEVPEEMYGPDAEDTLSEYERVRASARRALDVIDVLLENEKITPRDIKSITSALADIKAELGALSPRELREQQARLRQLEKSLRDEKKESQGLEIVFVGETEEASL